MMMLLALVPFLLLTLMQLLALVALRAGLQQPDLSPVAPLWPAMATFVAGAVLCCAALVLALTLAARATGPGTAGAAATGTGAALALVLGVTAGALVFLGPLLWGHATGEFTLSHHLVRALLVAPTIVLYCWYVTADR